MYHLYALWKENFYAMCEEQLHFLEARFDGFKPQMGVVLGSGMGGLAHHNEFQEINHLDFESIPGMTKPSTGGHEGVMYWGHIRGLRVRREKEVRKYHKGGILLLSLTIPVTCHWLGQCWLLMTKGLV